MTPAEPALPSAFAAPRFRVTVLCLRGETNSKMIRQIPGVARRLPAEQHSKIRLTYRFRDAISLSCAGMHSFDPSMASGNFSGSALVVRLLVSLALVFATYNPTGYSFYHWLIDTGSGPLSLKLLAAVSLAMIYYAATRIVLAAFRGSGVIVAVLVIVLCLIELALLIPGPGTSSWQVYVMAAQYVVLFAIAVIVSFGTSWSSLIERLTGQLQKRYVRR